jgi:hypothetical protein
MKLLLGVPVLAIAVFFSAPTLPEAPTCFDNKIQILYFSEVL